MGDGYMINTMPCKMDYYIWMLRNDRAFILMVDGKVKAFIGYFIGEKHDIPRFIDREPWSVIHDFCDGTHCYIDQLITDKEYGNGNLSFRVWGSFRQHILDKHRNVKIIMGVRYKGGKTHVRSKSIRD